MGVKWENPSNIIYCKKLRTLYENFNTTFTKKIWEKREYHRNIIVRCLSLKYFLSKRMLKMFSIQICKTADNYFQCPLLKLNYIIEDFNPDDLASPFNLSCLNPLSGPPSYYMYYITSPPPHNPFTFSNIVATRSIILHMIQLIYTMIIWSI